MIVLPLCGVVKNGLWIDSIVFSRWLEQCYCYKEWIFENVPKGTTALIWTNETNADNGNTKTINGTSPRSNTYDLLCPNGARFWPRPFVFRVRQCNCFWCGLKLCDSTKQGPEHLILGYTLAMRRKVEWYSQSTESKSQVEVTSNEEWVAAGQHRQPAAWQQVGNLVRLIFMRGCEQPASRETPLLRFNHKSMREKGELAVVS